MVDINHCLRPLWLYNRLTLSIHNESRYRNVLCTLIKTYISNSVHTLCVWPNLHQVHPKSQLGLEFGVMVMVLNATFSNILVISWWAALSVEETEIPRENHRPVTSF